MVTISIKQVSNKENSIYLKAASPLLALITFSFSLCSKDAAGLSDCQLQPIMSVHYNKFSEGLCASFTPLGVEP